VILTEGEINIAQPWTQQVAVAHDSAAPLARWARQTGCATITAGFATVALINRAGIAANASITMCVWRAEIMAEFVIDDEDIPHKARVIDVEVSF
jgi:hypothetical protein